MAHRDENDERRLYLLRRLLEAPTPSRELPLYGESELLTHMFASGNSLVLDHDMYLLKNRQSLSRFAIRTWHNGYSKPDDESRSSSPITKQLVETAPEQRDRRPSLQSRSSSPLPSLIVEVEPNRHDEPEEFYAQLAMKMKRFYRHIFIENRNPSSFFNEESSSKTSELGDNGGQDENDGSGPEDWLMYQLHQAGFPTDVAPLDTDTSGASTRGADADSAIADHQETSPSSSSEQEVELMRECASSVILPSYSIKRAVHSDVGPEHSAVPTTPSPKTRRHMMSLPEILAPESKTFFYPHDTSTPRIARKRTSGDQTSGSPKKICEYRSLSPITCHLVETAPEPSDHCDRSRPAQSSQRDGSRSSSPLPSLIVEVEPNRHDDPEEFYAQLAVRMKRFYGHIFIKNRNPSSFFDEESSSEKTDNDGSFSEEWLVKQLEQAGFPTKGAPLDTESTRASIRGADFGNAENDHPETSPSNSPVEPEVETMRACISSVLLPRYSLRRALHSDVTPEHSAVPTTISPKTKRQTMSLPEALAPEANTTFSLDHTSTPRLLRKRTSDTDEEIASRRSKKTSESRSSSAITRQLAETAPEQSDRSRSAQSSQQEGSRSSSPLPSLIVEVEPNRYDEPKEFYAQLAVKMKQFYKHIFEDRNTNSFVDKESSSKTSENDGNGSEESLVKQSEQAGFPTTAALLDVDSSRASTSGADVENARDDHPETSPPSCPEPREEETMRSCASSVIIPSLFVRRAIHSDVGPEHRAVPSTPSPNTQRHTMSLPETVARETKSSFHSDDTSKIRLPRKTKSEDKETESKKKTRMQLFMIKNYFIGPPKIYKVFDPQLDESSGDE